MGVRLARDSGAPVIIAQSTLLDSLPPHKAQVLVIDQDTAIAAQPDANPASDVSPSDIAYMIYTSGSTGRPKGVMVEHRNVANFFRGMDDRIRHDPPGVWLAVTSLSFDISVLELFYTLARGFKLVLSSDENRALVSNGRAPVSAQKMDFSLYYWGNDDGAGPKKYELLLEGAKFADSHGFEHDVFRPAAWPYRDYLIDRFNQDVPWDRMIREQLAADVFFPTDTSITPALGFLGAGTYDHSAAATAPTP